ncbi:MAG: hypothetical protein H6728_01700 [Myxococcales bacterium]|nr:hypothetical protein [Myxococcales bacterium]MCB9641767.1 hypothetical protein [Myxococcales bacterium]
MKKLKSFIAEWFLYVFVGGVVLGGVMFLLTCFRLPLIVHALWVGKMTWREMMAVFGVSCGAGLCAGACIGAVFFLPKLLGRFGDFLLGAFGMYVFFFAIETMIGKRTLTGAGPSEWMFYLPIYLGGPLGLVIGHEDRKERALEMKANEQLESKANKRLQTDGTAPSFDNDQKGTSEGVTQVS